VRAESDCTACRGPCVADHRRSRRSGFSTFLAWPRPFPCSGAITMSSSNTGKNSNGTNGSIILKSFSELASVLDLDSLPPGPPDAVDETAVTVDNTPADTESSVVAEEPASTAAAHLDLASVIAQLASISAGLETMARQDARARQQAT